MGFGSCSSSGRRLVLASLWVRRHALEWVQKAVDYYFKQPDIMVFQASVASSSMCICPSSED